METIWGMNRMASNTHSRPGYRETLGQGAARCEVIRVERADSLVHGVVDVLGALGAAAMLLGVLFRAVLSGSQRRYAAGWLTSFGGFR